MSIRTTVIQSSFPRNSRMLWFVLIVLVAVIAFINPVRETLGDDDFAYALMVRHLLSTGEYRLHDWATANMPVQIYLGAFLARMFGYSFTTLRASTLIVAAIGLVALYWAVRDRGASDAQSGFLTLVLLANPLLLTLAFSFMTDVQFLGWFVLALLLYQRALRTDSSRAMMGAAVSAVAAIGTRQFGVVLPAALVLAFLCDHDRRRRISLYLIGTLPPAVAGLLQFREIFFHPNFAQAVRLREQAEFLGHLPSFLMGAIWRLETIVNYVGLFLAPLAPMLLFAWIQLWRSPRLATQSANPGAVARIRHPVASLIFIAPPVFLVAGAAYGLRTGGLRLPAGNWIPAWSQWALALGIGGLGAAIVSLVYAEARAVHRRSSRSVADLLPMLTMVPLLVLHVVTVSFWDEYVLPFVPLTLIALARRCAFEEYPSWIRSMTATFSVGALVVACLLTRGALEEQQAYWRAAEWVRTTGVEPRNIAGATWPWLSYYGAVDEWLKTVRGDSAPDFNSYLNYLDQRGLQAPYLLVPSTERGDRLAIHVEQFRSALFMPREVQVVQRVPALGRSER